MTDRDRGAGFADRVIAWQRRHGRHDLPWQASRDPYRVWLSEVMLQQTQVTAALAYYERFVARFGDVHALAAAPLDDVLAAWSGLGYYARARNLHRAARVVVAEHGGAFPRSSEALAALPGIGRSTAAAIAAFCFGERAAILDGNVKRVLARVLAFEADLSRAGAVATLWDAATELLPASDVDVYTQGLMDLGSTICVARAPRCLLCPVRDDCRAARAGTQERYPVKARRSGRAQWHSAWLDLRWRGSVWLVRRPERGVWAGLWSLPEFESTAALASATAALPGRREDLPAFSHVLTHAEWRLQPVRLTLPARLSAARLSAIAGLAPGGRWFTIEEALALGLPAPLRQRLLMGPRMP